MEGKKASKGREVYYETTDSVFRIFYQMRYLNKQRRRLGFIIEFLQRWYSVKELREKIDEYKEQYEKYISESSLDIASEKLEKAFYFADTSLKMGLPEPHLDLIGTCTKGRDFKKAMEELEHWNKVIKKTKKNKLLYFWYKAYIYNEKKEHINELECWKNCVEIKPDAHKAWCNMGNAYCNLKQFEKAISTYNRAIKIKPDEDYPWYNMGECVCWFKAV